MEGIGQFDQTDANSIPLYSGRGRLLTEEERKAIAERRGQCYRCGVFTHARKGLVGKKPLSNDNVYVGVCIRCNPRKVPPHVYSAWDVRNKPLPSATVSVIPHNNNPNSNNTNNMNSINSRVSAATSSSTSTSNNPRGGGGVGGQFKHVASDAAVAPPNVNRSHQGQPLAAGGHVRSGGGGGGNASSNANTPSKAVRHSYTPPTLTDQQHRPGLNHNFQSTPAHIQQQQPLQQGRGGGKNQPRGRQLQQHNRVDSQGSDGYSGQSQGNIQHNRMDSQGSSSTLSLGSGRLQDPNTPGRSGTNGYGSALGHVSEDSSSPLPTRHVTLLEGGMGAFQGDSQRSMGSLSCMDASQDADDSTDGDIYRTTTPLEDEKAALGFRRTTRATQPGVQTFSAPNEFMSEIKEEKEETKTPLENEKERLGIVRMAPATRPGVQSIATVTPTSSNTGEPRGSAANAATDEKAGYRLSAPASRPGAQPLTSRDRNESAEREHPYLNEASYSFEDLNAHSLGSQSSALASLASRIANSADLKMSLQDDYKGDETKLTTYEYIKQLGENLQSPVRLRRVLHNLRNIEDDDQIDVLHPIKEILSYCASDPTVADVAAGVLWRTVAVGDAAKNEAMRSGAIDVILECLEKTHEEPQADQYFCQWALGVITSVSLNMENKESIAEKGGIPLVLSVMARQKKYAGVLEWGCRCLHNLVYCYDEEGSYTDPGVLSKNIASIQEAGGVDIIVKVMLQHPSEPTALLWAVKLLWRLLAVPDGANDSKRRLGVMHRMVVVRKLADAGFISLGSKLLRQHSTSGELLHLTAELITIILLGLGGDQNVIKLAVLVEKATEAVPNMIRAMKQSPDDVEIQAAGCRLLSVLCHTSGDIPAYLVDQGAINAISSAMIKLQNDETVAEAGTWALWKLSAEWKETDEIMMYVPTILVVLKVLGAVAAKHDGRDIQLAIQGFMANVSGTVGLQAKDFPIVELASGFFLDPHAGAAEFLSSMCSSYPESCVTMLQSLGLARIVTALNDPKSDVSGLLCPVLVDAAEHSDEARYLMISSGVHFAAIPILASTRDKDQAMSLLHLVSSLLPTKSTLGANSLPPKYVNAILSTLDKFGSSEDEFCLKILQSATKMVVLSDPSNDTRVLLPWVEKKIGSTKSNLSVRIEACNLVWAIAGKGCITDRTMLRNLLTAVLDFMMEFNSDNGLELNMEVQDVTAGALMGIASCIRNSPMHVDAQQVDTFMRSVYKARPLGDRAKNFMVRILIAIWHLTFINELTLLQAGVIILVMDIMSSYPYDPDVQGKCCIVLARLASSENIQITLSIVETDGVQMILEAMNSFPSDRSIQSEGANTLSHLTTDDETRMLVSAMGGVGVLVKAISSFQDDMELLQRTYPALLNLTSDIPEQFLDISETVRAVVKTLLLHPNSAILRENGLGILQNVCMKGPAAKEIIASEGAITTVVQSMEKFITTPMVMERGFSTLWSLAVLQANQSRIAEANGIDVVVTGMYASIEYERVQQQGCGCIFTLSIDPKNRMALRAAGAADAVTLAAKAHFGSPGVQSEVCRCLSGLSAPGEGNYRVRSISQDEIDAVIYAMQHFKNVEGVQVHGSSALFNFLHAKNASLMVGANKDMMVEAVRRASTLYQAQCSAISAAFTKAIYAL